MSDLEDKLDKLMADTFRPLPPRNMHGQMYENIPPGRTYPGGKPELYSVPYTGQDSPDEKAANYLHTFEPGSSAATFWKLKEFLGM